MYKFDKNHQFGLADFNQPMGLKMNSENHWVKKAEMIPWEVIEEKYAALFPGKKGMPAKPLRTALVIIYTFTRDNPSYVESKYHVNSREEFSLRNLGLTYHEKQICVTDDRFIVDKSIVNGSMEEFDEVII